jgi:hypothetical protein
MKCLDVCACNRESHPVMVPSAIVAPSLICDGSEIGCSLITPHTEALN